MFPFAGDTSDALVDGSDEVVLQEALHASSRKRKIKHYDLKDETAIGIGIGQAKSKSRKVTAGELEAALDRP